MKRILVMWCVVALVGVSGLRAQTGDAAGTEQQGSGDQGEGPPQGRHAPPSPQAELKRMTQALSLTDAQQTQILPILQKRQTDMQALRASGLDRDEAMAKRKEIMDASRTQVRALLTADQQTKFDAMRGPGGPGGPGGQGGPPQGGDSGGGPPQQ